MERWSKFDAEGVRLAKTNRRVCTTVLTTKLVPVEAADGATFTDWTWASRVENQIVVAERAKATSETGRAHTTIMKEQIKHECNLRHEAVKPASSYGV